MYSGHQDRTDTGTCHRTTILKACFSGPRVPNIFIPGCPDGNTHNSMLLDGMVFCGAKATVDKDATAMAWSKAVPHMDWPVFSV